MDFQRPFVDSALLTEYVTVDEETTRLYGSKVRAIEMSNADYAARYRKSAQQQKMKAPPLHGRIFTGYLVVRRLDSKDEYETWMPGDAFEDLYNHQAADAA